MGTVFSECFPHQPSGTSDKKDEPKEQVSSDRDTFPAPAPLGAPRSFNREPLAPPPSGKQQSMFYNAIPNMPVLCKVTDKMTKTLDADGKKLINHYEVGHLLGKGAYAKVKLCKDVETKKLYALKIMNKLILKKKRVSMSLSVFDTVRHGIDNLKVLRHQNIVALIEVIDDPDKDKLYMVLEYVDGGTLSEYLGGTNTTDERLKPMGEKEAKKIFRQVLNGLNHVHAIGIAHRDIKPENLMLSKDHKSVKIADFGVSCLVTEANMTKPLAIAGSPAFLAPELCQGRAIYADAMKEDVWALAVSVYQVVSGELPFSANNVAELYKLICESEAVYSEKLFSPSLRDFLKLGLAKKPQDRATVEQLLSHKWIKE